MQAVYELLIALPEYKGLTGPKILDKLTTLKPPIYMSDGTLKAVVKELKPYGLGNRPQVGYFIGK